MTLVGVQVSTVFLFVFGSLESRCRVPWFKVVIGPSNLLLRLGVYSYIGCNGRTNIGTLWDSSLGSGWYDLETGCLDTLFFTHNEIYRFKHHHTRYRYLLAIQLVPRKNPSWLGSLSVLIVSGGYCGQTNLSLVLSTERSSRQGS